METIVGEKRTKIDEVEKLRLSLLAQESRVVDFIQDKSRWDYKRNVALALHACAKNPTLLLCTAQSIFRALREAASIGLEVSSPLQEAALVPYKQNDGTYACRFQPMYQGMIAVARASGIVLDIMAFIVYEGDVFDIDWGRDDAIHHKPTLDASKRGRPIAAWMKAILKDTPNPHYEMMLSSDIEPIKKRVLARSDGRGPWTTDEMEMWRKTVTRRGWKYLPKTERMAKAYAMDSEIDEDAEVEALTPVEGAVVEAAASAPAPTPVQGVAPVSTPKAESVKGKVRSRKAQAPAQTSVASPVPPPATATAPAPAPSEQDGNSTGALFSEEETSVEGIPEAEQAPPAKAAPQGQKVVHPKVTKLKELAVGIDGLPKGDLLTRAREAARLLSGDEFKYALTATQAEKLEEFETSGEPRIRRFIRECVVAAEGE